RRSSICSKSCAATSRTSKTELTPSPRRSRHLSSPSEGCRWRLRLKPRLPRGRATNGARSRATRRPPAAEREAAGLDPSREIVVTDNNRGRSRAIMVTDDNRGRSWRDRGDGRTTEQFCAIRASASLRSVTGEVEGNRDKRRAQESTRKLHPRPS